MDYTTLILLAIPLLSIPLLYLVPRAFAKHVGLLSSIASAAFLLYIFYASFVICNCKPFQFTFNEVWVKSLGINFNLSIDSFSMLMLLLTNLGVPLIILSSYKSAQGETRGLFALILLMQAALLGVFMAADSFVFYLFYELALVPVFFIILNWGGENKGRINLKFFIYTLTGSLLMLVAIIFLYLQTGSTSFNISSFYTLQLTATQQSLVFWGFMMAFAVKIPLFPFHTWQPATYTVAPTQGTMLLSGLMLKMALYGIFRFVLPITPLAVAQWGPTVMVLAVIGVVYGAWIAIGQNNIKTLFAYSSLSHVGLIAAGMFTLTTQGMQGAMFQMVSHGFNAIGLFMIADILYSRLGTFELSKMGGIARQAPKFAILFFVILLGAVALPLTNGFVGEFLLLLGIFSYSKVMAAIAGLTIILGAVYMLNTYQKSMLGESNELTANFKDLSATEFLVLAPIAAIVLAAGIFPELFMNLTQIPVEGLLEKLGTGVLN
jgi:NADH-quinone oxidoreductase subunit M